MIFLEHRWLHNLLGEVPDGDVRVPLGKANRLREGSELTVVAMSYMTIEALHAVSHLTAQGVSCDLIDLRSVRPIDWATIEASVRRTGRLLVLDSANLTGSISGEIVARIASECWDALRGAPQRLAMPDYPEATAPSMTEGYHVRAEHIVEKIASMLGQSIESASLREQRKHPHDVPGDWFSGPF